MPTNCPLQTVQLPVLLLRSQGTLPLQTLVDSGAGQNFIESSLVFEPWCPQRRKLQPDLLMLSMMFAGVTHHNAPLTKTADLLVPLFTQIVPGLPWIRRLVDFYCKFEHICWSFSHRTHYCYNPLNKSHQISPLFLLNIVILVKSSVNCMLSLLLFTDLTIVLLICFLEYIPNLPITPLGHFKYLVMPFGLSGLTIILLFLQKWIYVWVIALSEHHIATARKSVMCEAQTLQCKSDRLTEIISVLTDKWWHSFAL